MALGVAGGRVWVLMPCLFAVGALMMAAIPTIQVRLTAFAPEAPTLVGALNLAALNAANSLGAIGGGLTIGAGLGVLSTVWAGFGFTLAGCSSTSSYCPRVAEAAPAATQVEPAAVTR